MKIDIIVPRFTSEEMNIPHDRAVGLIYLPADFYSFAISMRRLWMKPKRLRLMLIMNPVGFIHHEVRELPENREIEVDDLAVGECGVPVENRDEYAVKTAEKLVLRKYKTFIWDPEVEIDERKQLYKPLYIYRGDDETWLYDTYTGKKILVENPLFSPDRLKLMSKVTKRR